MIVIPAIDLMDGKVVRLRKGKQHDSTSYDNLTPLETALEWQRQGARIIHVIDLDSALNKGNNRQIITEIQENVDIPLQVGGGVRNRDYTERLLNSGISRIMLGSLAVRQPQVIQGLVSEYGPSRIVVALDYLNGTVRYRGWMKDSEKTLFGFLNEFNELGVEWFLVTSIKHDGALEGPDTVTYQHISDISSIIAAGGISSLVDLVALKRTGIKAVVTGKALYEGHFTLVDAQRVLEDS